MNEDTNTIYRTNIVVDKHNTWTLMKHVAGSVNKAASKVDAKVYGTKTNIVITPVKNIPQKDNSMATDICMGVIGFILIVGIFVAIVFGNYKFSDIPWF